MAIEGISSLVGIRQTEEQKLRDKVKNERTEVKSESSDSGDKVEVSGDIAKFSSKLNEIPEERTSKIEELQKAIADGTYKVPSEDIAQGILDELI